MSDTFVADYADFIGHEFQRPPFLVDRLIVSGGIHVIYGQSGVGKTQLVLTLAHHLLAGTPALGAFPTEPSRVCYFGVDMPLQQLQNRLQKLQPEVAAPDRFLIAARDSPIDITRTPDHAGWVEQIVGFDPDILFIDTLHKIHQLDENASQTVAQVYHHLKRVFGGERAIVLVHHEGKTHPDPRVEKEEKERQRGSSAWLDDADLGIRVSGYQNPMSGGGVKISFPRLRFTTDIDPIICEMDQNDLLLRRKMDENAEDLVHKFLSLYDGDDWQRLDIANWLRDEHSYSKNHAYRAIRSVLDGAENGADTAG